MYYYISGDLVLAEPNIAVIDAGGVGYQMTISGNTLGKLAGKSGDKVKLYTHLAVREDAMELFGFATQEELSAFRMLISVSGVGAKSAVSILSLMSPERFAAAVMSGDAKAIAKAQGIGGKTAARVILELKDKIGKEITSDSMGEMVADNAMPTQSNNLNEAANALMVLGYTRAEAAYALKGADPKADLEVLIKSALAKLMK
ncbi:MAG: Holliday junction branch migration protein RuvA [Ruminococcaceae bacterium]|nr:Holliday junction branch migration protein RuvA [Oscillospiraceae bacterium]